MHFWPAEVVHFWAAVGAPDGVDMGVVLRKLAREKVLRFVGPQPVAPLLELLPGCLSAAGAAEIEAEIAAA